MKLEPSIVKTARMANAQPANVLGEIRGTLEIQSVKKQVDILVIPSIPTELIIGLDTIRQFKMDILGSFDKFTLADLGFDLWAIDTNTATDVASCGLTNLTDEQSNQLNKLLDETIPPVKPDEILKATHLLKLEITLKDKNIKPIKQRYYPVSEKFEKIMHEQIAELKRKGIIEESASEWNNPIVMIKR